MNIISQFSEPVVTVYKHYDLSYLQTHNQPPSGESPTTTSNRVYYSWHVETEGCSVGPQLGHATRTAALCTAVTKCNEGYWLLWRGGLVTHALPSRCTLFGLL